ncbi:uncharacterized protein LOC129098288 [Anoplopoma fimbria]|uniref:uncharacterized protein LOC129098288 n=1 Tax=Anoplopoma fimbria TaxID=229290 RepID=UPI0023EE04A9|nr:uncharacterized protein LOC129098288 [Anoplopoma fimbria]
MQYEWAEDDFELPDGVFPLGLSEPINNRRYSMYHGTTKETAKLILKNGFRRSPDGMLGCGVYLSRDVKKASRYPIDHDDCDKAVIKVVVNVGKVIAINYQGHPRQKTWHDPRYGPVFDTAWVPPNCGMVKSGLEEDCVWDPDRIKVLKTINPRRVQPIGGGARGLPPSQILTNSHLKPHNNKFRKELTRQAVEDYEQEPPKTMPSKCVQRTPYRQVTEGKGRIQDPGPRGVSGARPKTPVRSSREPYPKPPPSEEEEDGESEYEAEREDSEGTDGGQISIEYQAPDRMKDLRINPWAQRNQRRITRKLTKGFINEVDFMILHPNTTTTEQIQETMRRDPDTIMQCERAEDDFALPSGVFLLGLSAPIDNGRYVMYHGTTKQNAHSILTYGFRQSSDGMLGCGVYLSRDEKKASRYPIGFRDCDKAIIKVEVNVGKVITISYQGHPRQKTWHDPRYGPVFDTACVPANCGMVKSGLEEDCVWDPNRIEILQTTNLSPAPPYGGHGAWGYY